MANKIFIVDAKRSPIGSFGGCFQSVGATDLAATVVKNMLHSHYNSFLKVDEIIMGCVLQAGIGQAPARQVAKKAALADHVVATTINKVCASGMKAVALAAQAIKLGDADVVIAGGMENMSQVPYYSHSTRWGAKYGDQTLVDGLQKDGLSDAYSSTAMGLLAEKCAASYAIDRQQQDQYAITSYQRSKEAWEAGKFQREIVPITVESRKGSIEITQDEEFNKVDLTKVSSLRAAFRKDGTVTAANASTISDGAAALLLMSEEKVLAYGLQPIAEIIAYADAEQEPDWFTTSPSLATEKVLKKAGLQIEDIDYFEFNEAFAVVALVNANLLHIPLAKINVYGGAISLGHPLGCSGARIMVTLASVLKQEKGKYGLAAICNGGGGASAIIIKAC